MAIKWKATAAATAAVKAGIREAAFLEGYFGTGYFGR